MICTSGRHGREQRQVSKAVVDRLHSQGLTPIMTEEVQAFIEAVEKEEQAPFDPHILMQSAMYSSLCGMLFGHRLGYGYEVLS